LEFQVSAAEGSFWVPSSCHKDHLAMLHYHDKSSIFTETGGFADFRTVIPILAVLIHQSTERRAVLKHSSRIAAVYGE